MFYRACDGILYLFQPFGCNNSKLVFLHDWFTKHVFCMDAVVGAEGFGCEREGTEWLAGEDPRTGTEGKWPA